MTNRGTTSDSVPFFGIQNFKHGPSSIIKRQQAIVKDGQLGELHPTTGFIVFRFERSGFFEFNSILAGIVSSDDAR